MLRLQENALLYVSLPYSIPLYCPGPSFLVTNLVGRFNSFDPVLPSLLEGFPGGSACCTCLLTVLYLKSVAACLLCNWMCRRLVSVRARKVKLVAVWAPS